MLLKPVRVATLRVAGDPGLVPRASAHIVSCHATPIPIIPKGISTPSRGETCFALVASCRSWSSLGSLRLLFWRRRRLHSRRSAHALALPPHWLPRGRRSMLRLSTPARQTLRRAPPALTSRNGLAGSAWRAALEPATPFHAMAPSTP